LRGEHEIAGTEDGGIAIVTRDQRVPLTLSIIPPSRDRIFSWKINTTPGNYQYAQAFVVPAGKDSFVFMYSGLPIGAENGNHGIDSSALCLLDTKGQFIDQCSFNGAGIQVPIGASREGKTIKLACWNGNEFTQLEWNGRHIDMQYSGDGRARAVPPAYIPGQQYQFGGSSSGDLFLARTGSSYSNILKPEEGELDSVWLDAEPGNIPTIGYGITAALGRWHPFKARGLGILEDGSVLLAGMLGEDVAHKEVILYRVKKEDLAAIGKPIHLGDSQRVKFDSPAGSAPPMTFVPQNVSFNSNIPNMPWTPAPPALLSMTKRNLALSDDERRGILVDDDVRIRSAPTLDANILAKFGAGTELELISRSAKRETIGSMEDYWLKVKVEGGLEGWIYGWFVESSDRENLPVFNDQ